MSGVTQAREVVVGSYFSCAIRLDKTVQCWGDNDKGQLGRGFANAGIRGADFVSDLGDIERLSLHREHACAVKADGALWCWGSNSYNELGNTCETLQCATQPPLVAYIASPAKVPLDNVVDVAAGFGTTCALTAEAKLYCWGSNGSGQLGNGAVGSGGPTPSLVRWK